MSAPEIVPMCHGENCSNCEGHCQQHPALNGVDCPKGSTACGYCAPPFDESVIATFRGKTLTNACQSARMVAVKSKQQGE